MRQSSAAPDARASVRFERRKSARFFRNLSQQHCKSRDLECKLDSEGQKSSGGTSQPLTSSATVTVAAEATQTPAAACATSGEEIRKEWSKLADRSEEEYSLPSLCHVPSHRLCEWQIYEADRPDWQDWIPIFSNCTGVSFSTYYENCNLKSPDFRRILGLWVHVASGETDIKMIAESASEFKANPKYASLISRAQQVDHNGFKLSHMSDFDL